MSTPPSLVDSTSPLTIVAFEFGRPLSVLDVNGRAPRLDRRVHHALSFPVLEGTRDLARENGLSLSRAALFLQIAGLVWIVVHVRWDTLLGWRRPHGNPRAPYDLGIPEPWLAALVGYAPGGLRPERLFRPDVSPVVYPATRRILYSQPAIWHRVVQEAARSLKVPAGNLLGLLQAAGGLVHDMGLPPARSMFASDRPGDGLSEWLARAVLVLAYAVGGQGEEARRTAMDIMGEGGDE